jgi:hypothetical protein
MWVVWLSRSFSWREKMGRHFIVSDSKEASCASLRTSKSQAEHFSVRLDGYPGSPTCDGYQESGRQRSAIPRRVKQVQLERNTERARGSMWVAQNRLRATFRSVISRQTVSSSQPLHSVPGCGPELLFRLWASTHGSIISCAEHYSFRAWRLPNLRCGPISVKMGLSRSIACSA